MARDILARHDIIPTLAEIFREYGFAGASLAEITLRTGLGKSSLYHCFPHGKKEMAEVVLNDVSNWFDDNVYLPLRESKNPKQGINTMFQAVDDYFCSGERICLIGAFSLNDSRDEFANILNSYFTSWNEALVYGLKCMGIANKEAKDLAEDVLVSVQGALVLARSRDDCKVFSRTLKRLKKRIDTLLKEQ